MKKLKVILCFSLIIYVWFITYNCVYYTKYHGNEKEIIGYIDKLKKDDTKISFELIAEERIIVNYYFSNDEDFNYKLGDYIKVIGEIRKPNINTVFNLFNYRKYLMSKKIYWTFNGDEITLLEENDKLFYKIKNNLIERLESIDNEYLYSFILGENSYIENEVMNSLRYNGVSHLFAISGMHVTILSLIIFNIFNRFITKTPSLMIVIFVLIFYAFLIGLTPSILRAVLMFVVLTTADIFNIKISKHNLLIIIVCILLLYNPFYIYSLGFLLSFIVTFFIISFYKLFNRGNYFYKLFMITFISFLAGLPLLIYNFNEINFFSIFVNLIMVPLISIIIFPFSLFVFCFPMFSNLFNAMTNMMEYVLNLFDNIFVFNFTFKQIGIFIMICYYVLIFMSLKMMNKKNYGFLCLLFFVLFIHHNINYFNKVPFLTMIDVDQGDSILIVLPYGKGNILIDTGGRENFDGSKSDYSYSLSRVIPYLKSLGIKSLDYLILTHGDFDHMGDSFNLINNFNIKKIIMNSFENNDLESRLISLLEKKRISFLNVSKYDLEIDNYRMHFINNKCNTENRDSLIIYTIINDFNILLMGDAEVFNEDYILSEYKLPLMDIIKIGHHGSKTSTSDRFVNTLKPKNALISVGKNNWYGHPTDDVISRLSRKNINIYRTDFDGSVRVDIEDNLIFSSTGR